MPRDLKNAPDHPIEVICKALPEDGRGADYDFEAGVNRAVSVLGDYETQANVTFVPLANDILVELKREYDRYVLGKSNALGAAIDSLLGLEDD